MKYKINDNVKLKVDKKYSNGDSIKSGTSGKIITVYNLSESYNIDFENAKMYHRVLEKDLELVLSA